MTGAKQTNQQKSAKIVLLQNTEFETCFSITQKQNWTFWKKVEKLTQSSQVYFVQALPSWHQEPDFQSCLPHPELHPQILSYSRKYF